MCLDIKGKKTNPNFFFLSEKDSMYVMHKTNHHELACNGKIFYFPPLDYAATQKNLINWRVNVARALGGASGERREIG